MSDVRKITNSLLERADSLGDYRWLAEAALTYMSEADVADMANDYGWLDDEDDLEEDNE